MLENRSDKEIMMQDRQKQKNFTTRTFWQLDLRNTHKNHNLVKQNPLTKDKAYQMYPKEKMNIAYSP